MDLKEVMMLALTIYKLSSYINRFLYPKRKNSRILHPQIITDADWENIYLPTKRPPQTRKKMEINRRQLLFYISWCLNLHSPRSSEDQLGAVNLMTLSLTSPRDFSPCDTSTEAIKIPASLSQLQFHPHSPDK